MVSSIFMVHCTITEAVLNCSRFMFISVNERLHLLPLLYAGFSKFAGSLMVATKVVGFNLVRIVGIPEVTGLYHWVAIDQCS